jgi:hypothetical protein
MHLKRARYLTTRAARTVAWADAGDRTAGRRAQEGRNALAVAESQAEIRRQDPSAETILGDDFIPIGCVVGRRL